VRGEAGTPPAIDFERHRLEVETARLEEWFAADPERPIYSSGRTTLPDVGPFFQEPSGLLFRIRPREASASAATRADSLDPWASVRTDAIRRDVRHRDALTREIAARDWVRRGEAAFTRGDRAAMAAAFDSALAVAPDNADLSSYVGAFHAQNDMLEAAIPLLERAVSQNPLSVRGWTNLGLALVKSGRREDGAAALRESLRIQPGQEQVAAMLRQLGGR
jgi:tetratricopeptide (TPR) repeat protein